jgi:hypothetical protein
MLLSSFCSKQEFEYITYKRYESQQQDFHNSAKCDDPSIAAKGLVCKLRTQHNTTQQHNNTTINHYFFNTMTNPPLNFVVQDMVPCGGAWFVEEPSKIVIQPTSWKMLVGPSSTSIKSFAPILIGCECTVPVVRTSSSSSTINYSQYMLTTWNIE